MTKVTSLCRVCGNLFTPCVDCVSDNSAFHWREVACSIECGTEYLHQVLNEREVKPIKTIDNKPIENGISLATKEDSKPKKGK